MTDQINLEIQEDLLRDKVKKIYNKYRLYIIFLLILLILAPILLAYNNFYLKKKNEKFLEEYSKAILLIQKKEDKDALKILNILKSNSNSFIKALSSNAIIEYYLEKKDVNKAIDEINYIYKELKNENELLNEISAIKKTLLNFDNISEQNILNLLKPNNNNKIFNSTINKILYDYYMKNHQLDKAKLFLRN